MLTLVKTNAIKRNLLSFYVRTLLITIATGLAEFGHAFDGFPLFGQLVRQTALISIYVF